MDINNYLERINYNGDLTLNISTLRNLQKHHLMNVPFENLDIHYGRLIELDQKRFYRKIVVEKRGGFCYELNALFRHLLESLGFDTWIISARVFDNTKGDFGPEYDHLAIIVRLNEIDFLVDVGFGEFSMHPLRLETNEIQKDPRGSFILERINDDYQVSKLDKANKTIEYKFTYRNRALSEFQDMCRFHQTSPDSHFTRKKLITRPTDQGRITLTGNTLKITEGGIMKERLEFEKEEYSRQLEKWFGINEMKLIIDSSK